MLTYGNQAKGITLMTLTNCLSAHYASATLPLFGQHQRQKKNSGDSFYGIITQLLCDRDHKVCVLLCDNVVVKKHPIFFFVQTHKVLSISHQPNRLLHPTDNWLLTACIFFGEQISMHLSQYTHWQYMLTVKCVRVWHISSMWWVEDHQRLACCCFSRLEHTCPLLCNFIRVNIAPSMYPCRTFKCDHLECCSHLYKCAHIPCTQEIAV